MMFIDGKEDFVFFSPAEPEFYWHRKPEKVERINVITPEELAAAESGGSGEAAESPRRFPWASAVAGFAGIVFFGVATIAKLKLPVRFAGLIVAAGLAFFLRPGEDAGGATVAAGVPEQRAVEIFKTLQANLYKAFDYETEDQVYDVLEQSVDGALLDDIYTEVYRSLLFLEEKSAAVCKVNEIDVLSCEAKAIDPSADGRAVRFDVSCHWRVHGLVEHFEHIHRRVNEYHADYRLTLKDSGWRITAVAVNQQDRLDPKTLKPSVDYGAGGAGGAAQPE